MQDVDGLLAKIDQLQQQLERLNAELARERSEKEKAVSAYNNLFKIHMDLTNKFCTSESQVPTQAPSSYSRQSSVESIQPEKENRAPIVPNRPDTRPPPRPELPPVPRSASENQIATKPLAERLNYWYTIPVSAKVRPDPEKEEEFLRNMSHRVDRIKEASRYRAAMAVSRRAVAMDLLNYRRQLDEDALSLLTTDPAHFYTFSGLEIRKSTNRFVKEAQRRRLQQQESELSKAANRLLSLCAAPSVRRTPQKKEVMKLLDHTRRMSPTLSRRASIQPGRETQTF